MWHDQWAGEECRQLALGETIEFRPLGNSMKGLIDAKDLVRLVPARGSGFEVNQIVLVLLSEREVVLHKIIELDDELGLVEIGDNRGNSDGWVYKSNIFGIVTHVKGNPVL